MNDLEDRLRTDLTAAVDDAAPPLPERSSITTTLDRRRRRRHATLLSAAAVLAIGFGLVAAQATMGDDDSDPVISSTTELPSPTTTSPTSTPSTTPTTTTSTTVPPVIDDGPLTLGTDALLGVPFGEDPASAIEQVAQAADGTVLDDAAERAADIGSSGFPCHGPNGPVVQELRHVVIDGDDVTLTLYIADGVFMGYAAAGSNPRYITPEGVGLGSQEGDLVEAYGDRLDLGPGISEPALWASLEVPGSPVPLVFEYVEGGPVELVVVGGRCSD